MKNLRLMCILTIGLIQASLYGAWNQPPDLVSNPLVDASSPSLPVLRVNPLGNAIAVWQTSFDSLPFNESTIVSAYYERGFGWFPSQIISSLELDFGSPLYQAQGDPSIAFNSTGYAVAAWEGIYEPPFNQTIIAARRNSNGNWDPVEIIGDNTGDFQSTDVNVSMNEAGTALAVWTSENLNTFNDHTTVSFLPFGGSWTTPFYFPADAGIAQDSDKPYGFINPMGNAVVVWRARDVNDGTIWHVSAATYNVGTNTWSSPVNLDTAQFLGDIFQLTPRCGMDAAGNAVAIWTAAEVSGTVAKAAYFNGTSWEPAITLGPSSNPGISSAADVVIDLNGNATAVWLGPTPDFVVYASSRLSNGTWTAPQVISTPGTTPFVGSTFNPFMSCEPLAVNAEGDVIAIWVETFGATVPDSFDLIRSGYKPFGQDWRAPETVFDAGALDTDGYNIGIASCGFAVALWFQHDGDLNTVMATENENLLLVQNPTVAQCCQKGLTQTKCVNLLTWTSDPCAVAYNIYCNGVLLATVLNTGVPLHFIDHNVCRTCVYTISVINAFGFEGDQVPVVFN